MIAIIFHDRLDAANNLAEEKHNFIDFYWYYVLVYEAYIRHIFSSGTFTN